MLRKFFIISLFFFIANGGRIHAQDTLSFWEPASQYNKKRATGLAIGLGTTYVASMTGLYYLWYADYPLGAFHGFDDNEEWLQVDKIGHVGSAYYLGKWGIDLMKWTGMPKKKATWMGGSLGLAFLTTIEVFDGFSEQWGFSTGDMIANVAGSALAISQELAWNEQRVKIKFSWHPTDFNQYNTELLGDGFPATLFKDYNGQTYWLSANIKSFLPGESRFPPWLNLAAGYGGEEMIGARNNEKTDIIPNGPRYERYRQYYLSADVDLSKIKTGNKTLKTIFGVLGFLKVPFPALELKQKQNNSLKFHLIYF